MKCWLAIFVLAVVAALALRLPELDRRPMHNDESVNAIKFGELWERGSYQYDPTEHHGPTLHYFTAAFLKLTGAPDFKQLSEVHLRIVTAIAGVLLVLLLPLARDALGRGAVGAAAIFTALSPVMVFYSRYWIHEQLLVLFTFVALAAGWNFLRKPSWPWAVLTGLAFGLMHATKETFVFVIAAAAGAVVLNGLWRRFGEPTPNPSKEGNLKSDAQLCGVPLLGGVRGGFPLVLLALAVWLFVWMALFTSFFTNWTGLLDSFRTYKAWGSLAGQHSVHAHEGSFYFERLFWFKQGRGHFWSEGLLLILAIVGASDSFRRTPRNEGDAGFVRFLFFLTVLLAGIYAVIPYKTPWCALGFAHGMILLAGVGAVVLWKAGKSMISRCAVIAVLVLGTAHLGWQAWRSSFPLCADRANPWVYGQTSPDLLNLVEAVQDIAKSGEGDATLISVVTAGGDCWPLPWYLRQFDDAGWWEDRLGDTSAPILIASAKLNLRLDASGDYVMAGYYQLRSRVFLELYVERKLWEKSVK